MWSFKHFAREIKNHLPLVREKRQIREIVRQKLSLDSQILHAQLDEFERNLLKEERYCDTKKLNKHEAQVFSQFGEDGIISEIFRRIGIASKTFVEIGVGDGLENNTTYLLQQGWSGYWIDGDETQIGSIHKRFKCPIEQNRLKAIQSFVTAENIEGILRKLNIPTEMDLFSLDIDRNTYEVWKNLSYIKPRVVVVEYNATIPPDIDWKVEYHANRVWDGTAYYGASLKAYENLGHKFGYSIVACNLAGVNAFFVRNDLCEDKFLEPFTSENHYESARYFLYRRNGHPAGFNDDI